VKNNLRVWTAVFAGITLCCLVAVVLLSVPKRSRSEFRRGETVVINERVDFWFDRFGAKVPLNQTHVDTILTGLPGVRVNVKRIGLSSGNTCSLTIEGTMKIAQDASMGRKALGVKAPGIAAVSTGFGWKPVVSGQNAFDGTNLIIKIFDVVP
jgi:hypothetical protein